MTSAESKELDSAAYNAFVADLELDAVDLVKVHGERTGVGHASQIRFDLAASYIQDEMAINYRYEVDAYVIDDDDKPLGTVAVTIQVTAYTTTEVDKDCIEQFGGTSGALIAHPYLREAVASAAQRIGFTGVLLPMIKQRPSNS
jgi:preprotein translocase subunit SecB